MPAIAGGLFAINREYLYEVSIYDDGMDICSGDIRLRHLKASTVSQV